MRTKIANINFDSCIFNASGVWGTTIEQMKEMEKTSVGAIVMKSCTKLPREGNSKPRVYINNSFKHTSLISIGLANYGWDYYIEVQSQIQKPVFISEGGLANNDDLAEFIDKINAIKRSDILIEFNFSCPNIKDHPQVGYDFEQFQKRIEFIGERICKPWGLKLPPYHDAAQIYIISQRFLIPSIKKGLAFITCSNSMGCGLIIDTMARKTIISPNHGTGGIGGSPLKAIALGNVWHFYKNLPSEISIIGCGGISTPLDAMDFVLAGAVAVEIATAIYDDCKVLNHIDSTFNEIAKGFGFGENDIENLRGTLETTPVI